MRPAVHFLDHPAGRLFQALGTLGAFCGVCVVAPAAVLVLYAGRAWERWRP